MRESEIQKAILDLLRMKYKIFCWKSNNVGVYIKAKNAYMPAGIKGVSDIIGLLDNGRFLAVEIKKPKCHPTKYQKEFLAKVNKKGGLGFVARSIDDVEKELQRYGKKM